MAVYHFKFPFMQKLFLFGSSALAMTCLLIACSSGKYTPRSFPTIASISARGVGLRAR